ncbi:MAG: DMT family transporter [Synergistaceae bacterium]|nr:DMT family transporter [Synergistaceae bacterium]
MFADLGLLYCAVFWGFTFPTMKILVGIYPACWLLFLRFSVGAALIYLFFHRRINSSFKKVIKPGAVIGILLFIAIGTQTVGLNYIGGGRSAFISATYVLMVPFIIWIVYQKSPSWFTIGAAVLCVLGMYFLSGDEAAGPDGYIGDILTVICALTFAVQVIAISRYTQDCDPVALSFAEFVSFAAVSFVTSLLFETPAEYFSLNGIGELVFTTVFSTFGCYMVQIVAQKYAEPSHATIIMSLESVFGLISSVIVLHESVTLRMFTGCALIFSAVIVSELSPFFLKKN